ncbi:MAG: lytic transglycosylase domain-containing protein [Flavobacteriaceae bacterium]|nr:lytic transglycosylase domain-containing protein [Flavobacteriaceae bacterium]
MTKINKFTIILSIVVISGILIRATQLPKSEISNVKAVLKKEQKNVADNYEIKALEIPKYLSFANERVPLEIQDVYERMDRELLVNTYWQSNALLYMKRANKYFPVIERILAENGIPNDFKYLALIESGLMNVTSPAGAKGVWQILKGTGKEFGLEINANIDERYHLEKSTKVACDYLKKAYSKFNNWTLAAAAYNSGRAGIIRKLSSQKVNSFYDLLLTEETSRYIFRIIAAKEILTYPKKYGFIYDYKNLYHNKPTYIVKVDTTITNITNFASRYGMNYKEFKILNPWLRENKLNNLTRKKYEIKLPAYE